MTKDEFSLDRGFSDFDEALGLGLAEDIRLSIEDRYLPGKNCRRRHEVHRNCS